MSESFTIPAHIENGSLHLDGPLPANVERVEVLAHLKARAGAATGLDLIAFLDALPAGKRSKAELDARLDAERNSWPD
jgi:hypothetical protein